MNGFCTTKPVRFSKDGWALPERNEVESEGPRRREVPAQGDFLGEGPHGSAVYPPVKTTDRTKAIERKPLNETRFSVENARSLLGDSLSRLRP